MAIEQDLTDISTTGISDAELMMQFINYKKQLDMISNFLSKLQDELTVRVAVAKDESICNLENFNYEGYQFDVQKAKSSYKFRIPKSEIDAAGLGDLFEYKVTQAEIEKALRSGRLTHEIIDRWQKDGWYTIENPGTLSLKVKPPKAEPIV